MLRGYFDESGHEGTGWVCIAGFVGAESQWQAFEQKWRRALGQRRFLHMHALRWRQERTRVLLERLGPLPYACGLEPARALVRVSDYSDLVTGTPEERLLKGYVVCVPPMLTQVLRGIPPAERLEVSFERQDTYERLVNMTLPVFGPRLAKWSFIEKGSSPRMDPADYLAYALREVHASPNSTKAKWCKPILGPDGLSGRALGLTLSRESIRRAVSRSQRLNRAQGL